MKKFVSLILCLLLCLPAAALAETTTDTLTVDFGEFTMELGPNDAYQIDPIAENEIFAIVYPDFDPNAEAMANFNVVWTSESPDNDLRLYGAETYANAMIEQTAAYMQQVGIKLETYELLSATYEDGIATFFTHMVADYTGIGVPITLEQYQLQVYCIHESDSVYIFTFTAGTAEELEAMLPYLDTIRFK